MTSIITTKRAPIQPRASLVAPKGRRKIFTFRLRTGVIFAVLFSTFMAAFVMHFGWRFFITQELNKFVGVLNREIIRSVTREVNSVFARAIQLQNSIRNTFQLGLLDVYNPTDIQGLYLSSIVPTEYTWISYGSPNGNFYGARKFNNGTLQWAESVYNTNLETATRNITNYRLTSDGLQIESTDSITNSYYSPARSWYRLANEQPGNNIWTPIYIFSTSGRPGINSAITLDDNEGNRIGVISIATELDRMSDFLNRLEISANGALLILNENLEIVAFPDKNEVVISSEEAGTYVVQSDYIFDEECQCWAFSELIREESGTRLRKIGQGNNVLLKVVDQAFNNQVINLSSLTSTSGQSIQQALYTYRNNDYLVAFDRIYGDDSIDQNEIYLDASVGLNDLGWYIGAVIPSDDIIGGIRRESFNLLAITYSAVLLFIFLILIFTNKMIVKPINLLTKQAEFIRNFDLDAVQLPGSSVLELNKLIGSIDSMNSGLSSFRRYVPTELVQQLITQGIEARLGGESIDVSIFFCDIANFTRISEIMGSEIVDHLDKYFTHFSSVITDCNGTIDKYIGDAIMAFWGAPMPQKDHAANACRSALLCERTLDRLRNEWNSEGKEVLHARYGVNTGRVLVGNFGSNLRMTYTAIGDPVNVASRLEALNKTYGTTILVGEETHHHIHDQFVFRHIDRVAVYGKVESTEIYELVGIKDNDYFPDDYRWIGIFEEGLELYRQQRWADAAKCFQATLQARDKEDSPSLLFIQRCAHLARQNVPTDWDGTFVLKSK